MTFILLFFMYSGQKTKYMIFIKTGDKRYAGTDANVFIQINGEKTMTKKKTLDDEKNNFERGQLDSFQVKSAEQKVVNI